MVGIPTPSCRRSALDSNILLPRNRVRSAPQNLLPEIRLTSFSHRFLPNDYIVMNHFTSTHQSSFFTYLILCTKFIMQDEVIVGNVTLFNGEVKERINGNTSTLATLTTERERVEALERYLGVKLTLAEKDGIKSMITEL
jgi:arylamine N-acetyltransferase